MSKYTVSYVGGWPTMMEKYPTSNKDLLIDELTEEDELAQQNSEQLRAFEETGNVYYAMEAFIGFHSRGLYPPKWTIDCLAGRLKKHMDNADSELFASQIGITARGSGSISPIEEYRDHTKRFAVLTDISILLLGFEISLTKAAAFVIERDNLKISEKRLSNQFSEEMGSPEIWKGKRRLGEDLHDPFIFDPSGRETFISDFPPAAQRYLREKSLK